MVSYFIPRGRFLIKSGHLRQLHHKQQQQSQQQEKWPLLRQFRRSLSSNKTSTSNVNNIVATKSNEVTATKADNTHIRRQGFTQNQILNDGTTLTKRELYRNDHRKGWSKWTGFLLRWAPLGICFFGALEWQLHKRKCQRDQLPRTASDLQSKIYRSLPLRLISRCWGFVAACYVPISLRPYIYGWYSRAFSVNIDEALYPDYKHYESLAEFFTRPLRDGVRLIDQNAPIVSPADGKVLHFGSATKSLIEQVKGVDYSIESFLGPPTWTASSVNDSAEIDYAEQIKQKQDDSTTLYQCVIYLAPGDYHRFHSPTNWKAYLRRHFSGELLSVSPTVAMWLPGLFCLNERVVYLGSWQHGFFSYTAVGATNVGSVQFYMDEKLKTNRWLGLNVGTHKKHEEYEELPLTEPKSLEKGDLVGQFNMGSTIVLLFEAPKNFRFSIEAGQKIRVGESLGFLSTD